MAPKRKSRAASTSTPDAASPRTKKRAGARPSKELEKACINNIRCLAIDVVQKAKSGHPGAPLGCAPMAHALWGHVMNFSSENPRWWNRDRFILSNGHASALQYTMLHLTGYLPMEQLKLFRQAHSRTPGHPEVHLTPGVEVCTGPLGQGISNAVGMAIAEEHLAAKYNRRGYKLFDHYTYVICGDGDLMEGVSSETASLAGHLRLSKLICLYDDNLVTIDGPTNLAFTENVADRYKSYGWQVLEVKNGDESSAPIADAIEKAQRGSKAPTLIIIRTTIGFGSAKEGTNKVHGAPLGDEDVASVKSRLGINQDLFFTVNDDVQAYYAKREEAGNAKYAEWTLLFSKYESQFPEEAAELRARFTSSFPIEDLKSSLPSYTPDDKPESTRALSGKALNVLAAKLPQLIAGSADLTESNSSALKGEGDFNRDERVGRYIRYGVREHGMCAAANGMAAYGGILPVAATFLNFLTYSWGSVRLAALSEFRVLFLGTHDSIELGEDGPTHQPIETLSLMRATPNMLTFRPADGNEVSGCYLAYLEHEGPSVLSLCRGAVPHLQNSTAEKAAKGAYIVQDWKNNGSKKVVLGSSGSEVHICVEAAALLTTAGLDVRVVSMPCIELFDKQDAAYQSSVIPPRGSTDCATRCFVEASSYSFYKHFDIGVVMDSFGMSAPRAQAWRNFGFTKWNIANTILREVGVAEVDVPDDMKPLPAPPREVIGSDEPKKVEDDEDEEMGEAEKDADGDADGSKEKDADGDADGSKEKDADGDADGSKEKDEDGGADGAKDEDPQDAAAADAADGPDVDAPPAKSNDAADAVPATDEQKNEPSEAKAEPDASGQPAEALP